MIFIFILNIKCGNKNFVSLFFFSAEQSIKKFYVQEIQELRLNKNMDLGNGVPISKVFFLLQNLVTLGDIFFNSNNLFVPKKGLNSSVKKLE